MFQVSNLADPDLALGSNTTKIVSTVDVEPFEYNLYNLCNIYIHGT